MFLHCFFSNFGCRSGLKPSRCVILRYSSHYRIYRTSFSDTLGYQNCLYEHKNCRGPGDGRLLEAQTVWKKSIEPILRNRPKRVFGRPMSVFGQWACGGLAIGCVSSDKLYYEYFTCFQSLCLPGRSVTSSFPVSVLFDRGPKSPFSDNLKWVDREILLYKVLYGPDPQPETIWRP